MDLWARLSRLHPVASDTVSKQAWVVIQGLFVTFLWSSSYVLITIGLEEIPALTFAGLRYAFAAGVLLLLFVYSGQYQSVRRFSRSELGFLVGLGLLLYAVTQGAQFIALQYLRAATVSLILSFTPAVVALTAIPLLNERLSVHQWGWIAVLLGGVGIYFHPFNLHAAAIIGIGVMIVGLLANAFSAILGRWFNRDKRFTPLTVTTVSMGIGSVVLLTTGVTVQGLPTLSLQSWAIVIWLAVVNTAFAFTLWNRTLQTLSVTESSVINNTMLVQVALLGWIFLGETIGPLELVGLALVMVGAIAVQLSD